MHILSSEPLHESWPPVSRHLVEFPDGRQRHWVSFDLPEGAATIAVTPSCHVVLSEQRVMASEDPLLMLPGGASAGGEAPERTARRELLEETGYEAPDWRFVVAYHNMPAYTRGGRVHLYLATGATPANDDARPIEVTGVRVMALDEAVTMVHAGEMPNGSTAMAVLLARDLLGKD
jgi:ADP-ribose pyrophosphatase